MLSKRFTNTLCLSNISKDFTVYNRNKDGLSGYAYDFSIDYNTIEVSDIIDNDKYLLKKNNPKQYLYYL